MLKNYKYYTKNSLSFDGEVINEYLDIPYAKSPVGKLRFLPPEEVTEDYSFKNRPSFLCPNNNNWEVIKNQNISENNTSEDCLVLNIWQPKKTNGGVLVIFHSQSFPSTLESLQILNGSIFSYKTSTIVVTISYRNGALGFSRLNNNKLISGNVGLLDQQLALKWIYQNIPYFNGDPNKITLFGEGDGAILASAHLYSNKSFQYFKKIILFPGHSSILLNIQKPSKIEINTAALLEHLKCIEKKYNSSLECLQNTTLPNIFESVKNIKRKFNYLLTSPFTISNEDNHFFKDKLEKIIKNGSFKKNVDIFVGSLTNKNLSFTINHIKDEGCYFNSISPNVHCFFNQEQYINILYKMIHKMLRIDKYDRKLKYYIKKKSYDKITNLVAEYLHNYNLIKFAKTFKNIFNKRIYSYSIETNFKFEEYPYQAEITNDNLLKYIFGFYFKNPSIPVDKNIREQQNFSLKLMLSLTKFILHGDVNKQSFNLTKVTWINEKINPKNIVIQHTS
uniref:COesterase domain-containing protein n=1 Tax=Strongyloides stercoralis TaxID=6248 RepID=A0A0K0DTZ0_STRER